MKRVLIHGYAVGITNFFRKKDLTFAGFRTFDQEIKSGASVVFYWAKEVFLKPFPSLNPFFYIQHYLHERELASSDEVQKKLKKMLDKGKPQQIICHSLGCFVLTEYLKKYDLPDSVSSVVFIQSGCSVDELLDSGLLTKKIAVVNIYRIIDPTLWLGTLFHRSRRLGVMSFSHPKVHNIYFPSVKYFNLHVSALRDSKIKKILESFLSAS